MQNKVNHSSIKTRFIPVRRENDPHSVDLVPVNEEVYSATYRDIWRIRSRAQDHGQCLCTKRNLWKCDGHCDYCEYHAAGDELSYDRMTEDSGNPISNGVSGDFADAVVESLALQQLIRRLEELLPEAIQIGERVQDGKSERQSLNELDLVRSTYRSRLEKVKEQLIAEFGEEFRQYLE